MIIEFSEFNLKLLLFLVYPIFILIEDYSKEAYIKDGKDNNLFITFRHYLSFIFSGIFLLIFKLRTRKVQQKANKCKTRNNTNDEVECNNDIKDDFNKKIILCNTLTMRSFNFSQVDIMTKKKTKKRKTFLVGFLFLLSILGIFIIFGKNYFSKSEYDNAKLSLEIFFHITLYISLSRLILNQKFYKHHFIAFGCITVILIITFILSFPYLQEILASVLFYFLCELSFGLYDVLIKKHMNDFYDTPYFVMFWVGIITTVILIIYDAIAYKVNPEVSGIIIGLKENINSKGDFFLLLLDLIIKYIWNLGIWLLIYYFTPCHFFISEYISEYIYYIINASDEKNDFHSPINCIIFSILFVVNIFFILILNEVIILNFCYLDYNTIKRIKQREEDDFEITLQTQYTKSSELVPLE